MKPLPARPSLEQLQKQAKDLCRTRADWQLADAQREMAHEYGFATWADLKQHVESARVARFETLAARLLEKPGGPASMEEARAQVARHLGFDDWPGLVASANAKPPAVLTHGLSGAPPYFRFDRAANAIEPRLPMDDESWDEIFAVMRAHRITGLRANGQMTDAALARAAGLDFVLDLRLDGSRAVTGAGMAHLARMPQLEVLHLSGCSIANEDFRVLRQLPALRELALYHHPGITDAGLAHLEACQALDRVDLLGTPAGDGTLRALVGKPKLRHLRSGTRVTDAGVALLAEVPAFAAWQSGEAPSFGLMEFDAKPTYLLLRGAITDDGLAQVARLAGVFALNLDDANLPLTARGIAHLRGMENLGWLGFDAKDEEMAAIATLPRLRFLMCQDSSATDAGWTALAASRTLEAIWGRRSYGLAGPGFRALSRMPALAGLATSLKNVDDTSLAALADFPALTQFMPMDVTDAGFRHVGARRTLTDLWCMYCRETGDEATAHLAGLDRLRTYYAGATRMTDRSLELLARMPALEKIELWSCAGVTNAGVSALAAAPRLRELTLGSMRNITRTGLAALGAHVRVDLTE
ncbi:MAG: hypothetical protein IT162_13165 [Bryobacterales bacterium]|nr:hypothetical protein [Bryobacterales bacterium]